MGVTAVEPALGVCAVRNSRKRKFTIAAPVLPRDIAESQAEISQRDSSAVRKLTGTSGRKSKGAEGKRRQQFHSFRGNDKESKLTSPAFSYSITAYGGAHSE